MYEKMRGWYVKKWEDLILWLVLATSQMPSSQLVLRLLALRTKGWQEQPPVRASPEQNISLGAHWMQSPGLNVVGRCRSKKGKGVCLLQGPQLSFIPQVCTEACSAPGCVRCSGSSHPPSGRSQAGVWVRREGFLQESDHFCSCVIKDWR